MVNPAGFFSTRGLLCFSMISFISASSAACSFSCFALAAALALIIAAPFGW